MISPEIIDKLKKRKERRQPSTNTQIPLRLPIVPEGHKNTHDKPPDTDTKVERVIIIDLA